MNELTGCECVRIYIAPIIWLIYSIALCARMWMTGALTREGYYCIILTVIWFLVFVVVEIIVAIKSVSNYDKKPWKLTWFNVPLFCFIIWIIGPYIYALHYTYNKLATQTESKIADVDFAVLQAIMPAIVLGNLFYPLPKRDVQSFRTASVCMNALNAFDIMDVVTDLKHIQNYGNAAHNLFYIAVVVSILLLAFPIGLDEEDEDDPRCGRIVKSIVSLIFTDIFLLALRSMVMHKEDSLEYGLVFAFKNAISAIVTIYMLIRACCKNCESCCEW